VSEVALEIAAPIYFKHRVVQDFTSMHKMKHVTTVTGDIVLGNAVRDSTGHDIYDSLVIASFSSKEKTKEFGVIVVFQGLCL
jgi:hypothetical protein